MFVPIYIAALTVVGLACALALVFQRLFSPGRCELVSTEWLSGFSVARYRPMGRLLSEDDYRFLARQKGYRPAIAQRLRRERIAVFRAYLRCIGGDFRRLEAALNLYMTHAPEDRPDLAKSLIKKRFLFTCAMITAKWRLTLYALGLGGADVRGLVGVLDGMRIDLRRVALARHTVPV